jgi:hypothetical protein
MKRTDGIVRVSLCLVPLLAGLLSLVMVMFGAGFLSHFGQIGTQYIYTLDTRLCVISLKADDHS